ncbi:hypothetical protein ACWDTI_18155 [Gordonia sp. NPDC003424]
MSIPSSARHLSAVGMSVAAHPASVLGKGINEALHTVTHTIQNVQDAAKGVITVIVPTQPGQFLSIVDTLAHSVTDPQEFRRSLAEVQQAVKATGSVDLNTVLAAVINGGGAPLADEYGFRIAGPRGSNGGSDGTRSTGTGIAIVAPEKIELVPSSIYHLAGEAYSLIEGAYNGLNILGIGDAMPALGRPAQANGTATISGDGYHVALASAGGDAFTHSSAGGLATAGAGAGRQAYALTIGGLAHAWNTDPIGATIFGNSPSHYPSPAGPFGDLLGVTIPDPTVVPGVRRVDAFGGISLAYAQGVGAALSVGGLLDVSARVHPHRALHVALTDPIAAVFTPQDVLGTVVSDILAGRTPVVTRDFVRLSTDGSSTRALTSGYGFSASVAVHWLGSTLTFAPLGQVNGSRRPNYLALPAFSRGALELGRLLPSAEIPRFDLPFGLAPVDSREISLPGLIRTARRRGMTAVVPLIPRPAQARV